MCVCVYVGGAKAEVWGWEVSLQEFVLSFHHVGLRDGTQAIRVGSWCLYPLNHLHSLGLGFLRQGCTVYARLA